MDIHKTIARCLAFYEAFRRLGFAPAEIIFAVDPTAVGMMLRAQGKDFPLYAGPVFDGALEQWQAAARLWNDSGPDGLSYVERRIIWTTHMPVQEFVELTAQIVSDGYAPPGLSPEALSEVRLTLSINCPEGAKA